jgi:hypothetical protein
MTDALIPIAVPVALIVLGILTLAAIRARDARRGRIELKVRQIMLQQLVTDLGDTLADPALSADGAGRICATLIAQMQSYNTDGSLDAFIADNQASVAEALAARRAGGEPA